MMLADVYSDALKRAREQQLDAMQLLKIVGSLQGENQPQLVATLYRTWLDSNPTAERIARLVFDISREKGLPVSNVTGWDTPSSWATYVG